MRQGPLEWLWRGLTCGRWSGLRREITATPWRRPRLIMTTAAMPRPVTGNVALVTADPPLSCEDAAAGGDRQALTHR